MLQYNHETSDIARPSEVLHSIRAFMSALRNIELHGKFELLLSWLTISSPFLYKNQLTSIP